MPTGRTNGCPRTIGGNVDRNRDAVQQDKCSRCWVSGNLLSLLFNKRFDSLRDKLAPFSGFHLLGKRRKDLFGKADVDTNGFHCILRMCLYKNNNMRHYLYQYFYSFLGPLSFFSAVFIKKTKGIHGLYRLNQLREGYPMIKSPQVGAGVKRDVLSSFLKTACFLPGAPPLFQEMDERFFGHFFLIRDPQDLLHMTVNAHFVHHAGRKRIKINGNVSREFCPNETQVIVSEDSLHKFLMTCPKRAGSRCLLLTQKVRFPYALFPKTNPYLNLGASPQLE